MDADLRMLAMRWSQRWAPPGGATPLLWGRPRRSAAGANEQRQSVRCDPVYQDPELLDTAFTLPVAGAFARAGGLQVQRNPTFCGPASVVGVARSLGIEASQRRVLEGTGIRTFLGWVPGLTLDQVARVTAQLTRRAVTVLRDLDLPSFRTEIARVNDPRRRYLVNFSRRPLFGHGGGHHSPIAAYLERYDAVLVLDVNPRYGPWLVRTERLFEAVVTSDRISGRSRGLVRVCG